MSDVRWIGCAPPNWRSGRGSYCPEAIVIHIVVGSLKSCDNSFTNPRHGKSAHYAVGRTGQVHQYVAETDTAFHAGTVVTPHWPGIRPSLDATAYLNPNRYTIGIEHEGYPDDVWPDAQYDASSQLIAQVATRWQLPIDRQHVIPHREIRATKTCPGDQVDLARLIEMAKGLVGNTPPLALEARVSRPLRIRQGQPSTRVVSSGLLRPGQNVRVLEVKEGEDVGGNSRWYRIDRELWVWSGGTELLA